MYTMLEGAPEDSVYAAVKRVNIWHGPVRSAKTIHSLIAWIWFVLTAPKHGEIIMIGVTEDTLERNVLKPLAALCRLARVPFTYSKGGGVFSLGGRQGWILGASNRTAEGKIRGATCAAIYGDELSLWPTDVLKQCFLRLSVLGARFYGTTNPSGPYHPLKIDIIDKALELDYAVFYWPIDANTALDPAYLEAMKKQFTGLWFKRFILGLWVAAEGAIYDFWDEDVHTFLETPGTPDYFVVGIDYGTSNATAACLMAINEAGPVKAWTEAEYYHSGRDTGRSKTDGQYATEILEWLEGEQLLTTKRNAEGVLVVDPACVTNGYPTGPRGRLESLILDPSAASFRIELILRNLPVRDADNSVIDGVRTQANMLNNGQYKVNRNCKQVITDYSAYLWDIKAQARGEDKPLKGENDGSHTKDCERYPLQTIFGAGGGFFIGSAG